MNDKDDPFVLAQLEEALEERQTPDRRQIEKDEEECRIEEERRQGSRRTKPGSTSWPQALGKTYSYPVNTRKGFDDQKNKGYIAQPHGRVMYPLFFTA